MFANHSAADALRDLGAFTRPPSQSILDAVEKKKVELLDATNEAAASHAANEIRDAAVASVMEWANTPADDLDEGETLADRLLALNIGIADENKDGEISDDEADVIEIALNAGADYLVSKGATEADVTLLIEKGDNDAAERVRDLIAGGASEDDDAAIDGFVFDAESAESVMDGILDAVYKKKMVIRGGKKMRVNKRVSGKVRLSAAQKVSIRKAGLKARSSVARMRRMKSMKMRRRTIG